VLTNCTEAALRAAMAWGGTVTFACDGTITLASTITNTVNVTLDGSGHHVTISGGNAVRVFSVSANATLALVNLTIANGAVCGPGNPRGAGILNSGGTVNATNCTFSLNVVVPGGTRGASGGGAICSDGGLLQLLACDFVGNQAGDPVPSGYGGADGEGGAIDNGGTAIVDLCTFTDNMAFGTPSNPLYPPWAGQVAARAGPSAMPARLM